jgi:hypothetical protein
MYGEVVLRAAKSTLETGPLRGRPAKTPTTETEDKVDALIRDDCCITSEQCFAIWFENPAVMIIIRELGYRNIGARWVPRMLTVEHKTEPKTSVLKLKMHWSVHRNNIQIYKSQWLCTSFIIL